MGNKFGAFLAGGLLGAAVALLYAPRAGHETRALVSDKMNAAWGEAQEFGSQASSSMQQAYQEAAAKGQSFAQGVAEKGQELYGVAATRVQEATDNIKPAFADKNDELRAKIEAARQRIASQVVKNAEEAQDAAQETVPYVPAIMAEEISTDVKEAAQESESVASGSYVPDASAQSSEQKS